MTVAKAKKRGIVEVAGKEHRDSNETKPENIYDAVSEVESNSLKKSWTSFVTLLSTLRLSSTILTLQKAVALVIYILTLVFLLHYKFVLLAQKDLDWCQVLFFINSTFIGNTKVR